MDVAVLVDRNRLASGCAYYGLCAFLVLEVDVDSSVFAFYEYEADMVLGKHWVRVASYLDLVTAVIKLLDGRKVLFLACIDGVGNQLLHFLSAAEYRYLGVYKFVYNVAAMAAFKKLACHINVC